MEGQTIPCERPGLTGSLFLRATSALSRAGAAVGHCVPHMLLFRAARNARHLAVRSVKCYVPRHEERRN